MQDSDDITLRRSERRLTLKGLYSNIQEYPLRPPAKRRPKECYIPLEFHLTQIEQDFVKDYFKTAQEIKNQLQEVNSESPDILQQLKNYPNFKRIKEILKENLSLNKRYDTNRLEKNLTELERFRSSFMKLVEDPRKKNNTQKEKELTELDSPMKTPLEKVICRLQTQSDAFKRGLKGSIHTYKRKLTNT